MLLPRRPAYDIHSRLSIRRVPERVAPSPSRGSIIARITYVVVDTGRWLPGRRVLISPLSFSGTAWGERRLQLSISRQEVENSPGIDTHQPVSRRQEQQYFDYYRYPYYWGQVGLWGAPAVPMMPTSQQIARQHASDGQAERTSGTHGDAHLRSVAEVCGYVIHAVDGDLGHVDDVLFDDSSWATRYLVIDTSNWWFGQRVLIAPEWITEISWIEGSVAVKVTRQDLKAAPKYSRAQHLDRQWELEYYRHLQQPGYWLTADDARAIKQAQSYLNEVPDRHEAFVERRSRPR